MWYSIGFLPVHFNVLNNWIKKLIKIIEQIKYSPADLLMDLLYIPFFTVDALAIYHQSEFLYHIWHVYAMLLFGTSRMGKPRPLIQNFVRKTS